MPTTKEKKRKRNNKSVSSVTKNVIEQQKYGERLIKLSEYSASKPLTEMQQEVLNAQAKNLDFLGLEIIPQLNSAPYLKASQKVGSARFVHGRNEVIVQVEPWAGEANFLQMLDRIQGYAQTVDNLTRLSTEQSDPVGIFLDFFAEQTSTFLHRLRFRNYAFAVSIEPGKVKGRPLINQYLTKSLPSASPQILPSRYLDYTSDVLENQIIAFAVHIATQMTSLITPAKAAVILKKLRTCARLLNGVSIKRITINEIRSIRYSSLNRKFSPIHKMCEMIVGSHSISLKAGERIPFLSMALDMARLFESYVGAAFASAFGNDFVGSKSSLRFPVGLFDKHIILDGMLNHKQKRIVIECKYKNVGRKAAENLVDSEEGDFVVQGGKIRSSDIYQVAAYAVHEKVRADACFLLYPSRSEEAIPIELSSPITSFGWQSSFTLDNSVEKGIPIYLVGVNLSTKYEKLVKSLQAQISRVITTL